MRRLTTLVLVVFGMLSTLAVFAAFPPKAAALTPGCWIAEAPAVGPPGWHQRDCSLFKKLWPTFQAEEGRCYLSWASETYVATPPIRSHSCNSSDTSLLPSPADPPQFPFRGIPGGPPAIVINTSEVNCFVEDGQQGYRKVTCPPNNNEPGCYLVISGVGESGVSTIGSKIPDCSSIQNAVIEGQQNDDTGEYNPTLANADECGAVDQGGIKTSINIGCQGKGNPIIDMVLAITRFLSAGAGIVCVASMIVGAIQFTASGGNPKATSDAVKRMASSAGALVFFLFIYAILNWIVPGGLL